MREDLFQRLNSVFRHVFNDDNLIIERDTVAGDIVGWDSIEHFYLISRIEKEFNIKFSKETILGFRNVGEIFDAIVEQIDN